MKEITMQQSFFWYACIRTKSMRTKLLGMIQEGKKNNFKTVVTGHHPARWIIGFFFLRSILEDDESGRRKLNTAARIS